MTIIGRSFGSGRFTTVTVAGVNCSITDSRPTRLECLVPPGVAVDAPVIVTVAGQTSNPLVARFSYDPPSFTGVIPEVLDARVGGTIQVIGGSNFGGTDEVSQVCTAAPCRGMRSTRTDF